MNKSVLFVYPDYHCSFIYRDQLRERGWKADIYAPDDYPSDLLFDSSCLIKGFNQKKLCNQEHLRSNNFIKKRSHQFFWFFDKYFGEFFLLVWYLKTFLRYKYLIYYSTLDHIQFPIIDSFVRRFTDDNLFRLSLFILKITRRKIIYLPTGVSDEEMPEVVAELGEKEVGYVGLDSVERKFHFDTIRRYARAAIGTGTLNSTQYKPSHLKWKSLDLNKWNPNLQIPEEFILPNNNKIRILHSFKYGTERIEKRGDIKGSYYVKKAIDLLITEGHEIEYLLFNNVNSRDMRYYQAQADIVIEQLIRGWWGSTGAETMSLGKPVICYLRPSWKKYFFKTFTEYKSLPIIEANKENIATVLKEVIENKELRVKKSIESRKFAESFFDPQKNTTHLIEFLSSL